MDTDVIVVGAGPGGSSAGREIAARGARVLLLDRATFPRDKPCGGAVTIRCAELLPFDLSPVVEQVVRAVIFEGPDGETVTGESSQPLAYLTQRRRLDAFLVDRACEAGVEFRDGQAVRTITELPDGTFEVRVGGPGGDRHVARVLIGADGANGVVAASLGFEAPSEYGVALEGNLPSPGGPPPWLRNRILVTPAVLPGGYGWLFPKADHINVGVGGWKGPAGPQLHDALEAYMRRYDWDPEMLRNLRGHHLPMQRPGATLTRGAAALVGDAAGLVDPLSGEGIYAAVASGSAVAPAVAEYLRGAAPDLTGYDQAVTRRIVPELERSRMLMEIAHAWPRSVTRAVIRSRPIGRLFTGLQDGERAPARTSAAEWLLRTALRPAALLARRISLSRYPTRLGAR